MDVPRIKPLFARKMFYDSTFSTKVLKCSWNYCIERFWFTCRFLKKFVYKKKFCNNRVYGIFETVSTFKTITWGGNCLISGGDYIFPGGECPISGIWHSWFFNLQQDMKNMEFTICLTIVLISPLYNEHLFSILSLNAEACF